ncbi:uncharacterized protein LOC134254249 [Saccostrea cucullata]|uniref:uncharacterized protein LOC134254249 n=1 Tax=Saccostrea cuccullata TaxID=36930 RepID=UPI002ED5D5AA
MNPRTSGQDVLRCDFCKNNAVEMFCTICPLNLCKECVGGHIVSSSEKHYNIVVPFSARQTYPLCRIHPNEKCEVHCVDCNVPVCTSCIVSDEHTKHTFQKLEKTTAREISKAEDTLSYILEIPEFIGKINTGFDKLQSVTCLDRNSEKEIWVCGDRSKDIKCFNNRGKLLKVVEATFNGVTPVMSWGLAVDHNSDLMSVGNTGEVGVVSVFKKDECINLVKDFIWLPVGICVTASGGIFILQAFNTECYDEPPRPTKLTRYTDTMGKLFTIICDNQGKCLFSRSLFFASLTENKNLDICVADNADGAIVVVNESGTFRFKYTGKQGLTKSFKPYGIATDMYSQILTTDRGNNCIHILDKDGHFLRFINNIDLHDPWELCVDSSNNLYVTERSGGIVKIIKYLRTDDTYKKWIPGLAYIFDQIS